jgi:hypothetical protein
MTNPPPRFPVLWLTAAASLVAIFGLSLVVAPALAQQGFSLLVYADPSAIEGFGPEAARYTSLAHAVLGGVMFGWGIALFMAARHLVARGHRLGWHIIAVSLAGWYVPDTLYSLASGYWQNAVLNTGFAALFVIPLALLRPYLRTDD